MIRDFTTGKTKFVQVLISAPDGRFGGEPKKGGITKEAAIFHVKKLPKEMIIDIFDSFETFEEKMMKNDERP